MNRSPGPAASTDAPGPALLLPSGMLSRLSPLGLVLAAFAACTDLGKTDDATSATTGDANTGVVCEPA